MSRVAAATFVTAALVWGLPPSGSGRSVSSRPVTLSAASSTVRQGAQFGFTATLHNKKPNPLQAIVLLQLSPPGSAESPVYFRSWKVSVPVGGTVSVQDRVVSSQWFPELGTFGLTAWLNGRVVSNVLSYTVASPAVTAPFFQDVTASAGISTNLPGPACGEWEAGAAWGDADGDGMPDLYVPSRTTPAQLWMNDGTGHFTDQAAQRGVDNAGRIGVGAIFADYDNDGDADLYVVNDGPNRLFRNDGDGHFTDVAAEAGVADASVGPSAAWGDYDNDGYLDLYVANHVPCDLTPQQDRLYHNNGDGTFTDVTYLLPVSSTMGAGLAVAWLDYNGDGRQDLYLGNDYFGTYRDDNHLWRNDGPGVGGTWLFTDVSDSSGTGYQMHSMGIAVGDYDRDGRLDMAISNVGANVLARNQGDGTFRNVARPAGVDRPTESVDEIAVTWGLHFYDLNLDGWEDLILGAGRPYGPPQPDELFANAGGGRFLDLSAPSGIVDDASTRGMAFADYDANGSMDVFVVNVGSPSILLQNVTPTTGEHWLEVRMEGTLSNADGCGARLEVRAGSNTQVRQVLCGSGGLASGSDRTVHFGLGSAAVVDRLLIMWPSGVRQVLQTLPADQVLVVTEPTTGPGPANSERKVAP